MKNPFGAISGGQKSEINMAVGNVYGVAVFATAGNFFEAELILIKLRELRRFLGEKRDVSNPGHLVTLL